MNRISLAVLALSFVCSSIDRRLAAEELPADLGTRPQGIDWSDFLGPRRDSRSPETGVAAAAAAVAAGQPPKVLWQCELGESYGAPTISRGRLFHFDRHGTVHRLTCRRSETGDQLWKYELPADFTDMLGYNNGPRSTPVVDGSRVYVMSPEGRLHCVAVADGKPIWEVDTLQEFGVVKNFFGVGGTPIVWGDLLIANIGGSPADSPPDVYAARGDVKGNGSGVVAFDKFTGKVRWQATDELASYSSPVIAEMQPTTALQPPVPPGGSPSEQSSSGEETSAADSNVQAPPGGTGGYRGGPLCFVFARGGLLALDPANGSVKFHFPWRATKLESVNASSPTVVDNQVFISEAYGPGSALLRVTGDGYDVVWQDKPRSRERAMELHWNTAIHHEGYLYGSSGQHGGDAELRCVELATGKVLWREPNLARSSLLYADGHFICLSEDGGLRLLKATPEKYEQVAEITPRDAMGEPLLSYPAWAAPVLSHGLLYVRGEGRLVCLELAAER